MGVPVLPSIPPELRLKGGPRRYEAIFVGYEDNRIGWRVHDMAGKYHFSPDVIFNESVPGQLSPLCGQSINHTLLPPPSLILPPVHEHHSDSPRPHTALNPLPSPTLPDILRT